MYICVYIYIYITYIYLYIYIHIYIYSKIRESTGALGGNGATGAIYGN
jgi:hypothetical protein